MNRAHRRITFLVVCAILIVTSPSSQMAAQSGTAITDPDAYAVYRAAFALPGFTDFRNSIDGIALLDETRFEECAVNPNTPAEWLQLLSDFRAQNATARTYMPAMLDLGVPVELVPLATVTALLKSVGFGTPGIVRGGWGEAYDGFPQRTLLTFSAVGFNADKSLAMITVARDCGLSGEGRRIASGDCHRFNTFMMRREQGQWIPAHGPLARQCIGVA
jgi:hypothetical protein